MLHLDLRIVRGMFLAIRMALHHVVSLCGFAVLLAPSILLFGFVF